MTEPEGLFEPSESSEPSEPANESDETPPRNRRGRPRTQDTIARDARVLESLQAGPKSREQLAEELGEPTSLIYLALWRLKRNNKVEKTANDSARHAWQLTA